MKLLKIEENCGHFRKENGTYSSIDKIDKEDLLRLVNWTLHEDAVMFDEYDDKKLKNHAHQIIYKNVVQKLDALRKRRQEFIDESARLFLDEYEKYGTVSAK